MRKYIYKKKEKFNGSFELQRWVARGTYYVFDCIINETNKDYNDWNKNPEIISFNENDKLQYNQRQRELRQKKYEQNTDNLLFKVFELSENERETALQNYVNAKNEIRNNLKYL